MEKSLNQRFVELLELRSPHKPELVTTLSELLKSGKETVYRRLKDQVPFTFEEIVKICYYFKISLDDILYANSSKLASFRISMLNYFNPQETDYELMERFIGYIKSLQRDPDSEFAIALNTLPQSLSLTFENIYKFYLLKWKYLQNENSHTLYGEVKITDRLKDLNRQVALILRNAGTSFYIWDKMVFQYLVNDIIYFTNIRLISTEEVELLKSELFRFIDFLEGVAIRSGFNDPSGGAVNFYVSNINFESSYTYYESSSINLVLIKNFILNAATSFDKISFDRMKNWISALKKTSTLISGTGEAERRSFFHRQREVISVL